MFSVTDVQRLELIATVFTGGIWSFAPYAWMLHMLAPYAYNFEQSVNLTITTGLSKICTRKIGRPTEVLIGFGVFRTPVFLDPVLHI